MTREEISIEAAILSQYIDLMIDAKDAYTLNESFIEAHRRLFKLNNECFERIISNNERIIRS